jgi:DNA-binding NarL/FixJ family response regulator
VCNILDITSLIGLSTLLADLEGQMLTTVLLADDNESVRKAIVRLLQGDSDIQVLAQGTTFAQTIELASKLHPQVIVLDIHMNDERTVTPVQLKSALMGSRLLAMSIWNDDETKSLAKTIGAAAFLDKSELASELIPAIKQDSVNLSNS